MPTIGEKIKNRRKMLGLTQEDLAGEYLSRPMISLIERDLTTPSLKILEYISNALGLKLSDLIDNEETIHENKYSIEANLSRTLNVCKLLIKSKNYNEAESIINNSLKSIKHSPSTGSLHLIQGELYILKGNYDSAITTLKKALIYIPATDIHNHIETYHFLAKSYKELGDFHSSIENAIYAILFMKKSFLLEEQHLLYIKLLYILSFGYCKIGQYRKGIEYIDEAITFQEESDISYLESSFLMLKGLANLYLENFEDGITSTIKALEAFKSPKDNLKIVGCLTNLGILYRNTNELEKSIATLEKSLSICSKNNLEEYKANNLYELSLSYIKQKDYDLAIQYAYDGVSISKKKEYQSLHGKLIYTLAKAHYDLTKFSDSLIYLNQAEQIFQKEENIAWVANCLELKASIFFTQDMTKDAYITLKRAYDISVEINEFNLII